MSKHIAVVHDEAEKTWRVFHVVMEGTWILLRSYTDRDKAYAYAEKEA
jgi:hypothetical protein